MFDVSSTKFFRLLTVNANICRFHRLTNTKKANQGTLHPVFWSNRSLYFCPKQSLSWWIVEIKLCTPQETTTQKNDGLFSWHETVVVFSQTRIDRNAPQKEMETQVSFILW